MSPPVAVSTHPHPVRASTWTSHVRYCLRAMRWQAITVGAGLGALIVASSHVVESGPLATPHLGVSFGIAGIAVGAAFVLDDPGEETLAAVPVTLRRRSLLRLLLTAVLAAAALAGLTIVAWELLGYVVAAEVAGFAAVGVTGAAVGGRLAGRQRPGIIGAAAVAGLVVADAMGLGPGDEVLLSGGATVDHASPLTWLALSAVVVAGSWWGTRDPGR